MSKERAEALVSVRPMLRALFSLFRKKGRDYRRAVRIAKSLAGSGCEILASGGTAVALQAEGVPVTDLDAFFKRNAPEGQTTLPSNLFGGFVRTISPQVFGGVFAQRGDSEHDADLIRVGSRHIDVLVYDFYPENHVAREVKNPTEAVFQGTDIGGPAVISAGIKAGCWTVLPASFEEFLLLLKTKKERVNLRKANLSFRSAAQGLVAEYEEARAKRICRIVGDLFWLNEE